MNKNRIIASTVLVGALIGAGAPAASAMPQAGSAGAVQVQTLDTHRTVLSLASRRIPLRRLKEDMSKGRPSVTPDEAPASVGGDAWPVIPLGLAALLLRTLGDHTWAYVVGAVIGGFGLLTALIGLAECVRAVRRGLAPGKAAWVAVLLLAGGIAVVNQLVTA